MKTLNQLPPRLQTKVLNYCKAHHGTERMEFCKEANSPIRGMFNFSDTTEGIDYWEYVSELGTAPLVVNTYTQAEYKVEVVKTLPQFGGEYCAKLYLNNVEVTDKTEFGLCLDAANDIFNRTVTSIQNFYYAKTNN